MLPRASQLALDEDGVGDVRGLGFIAGVQIVEDKETMKPFHIDLNVGPRLVGAASGGD